ncbi:MAG: TolC family protein [Bacteroidales bacterium]|nr:TolC family protein [Bacteroidales bacterium]
MGRKAMNRIKRLFLLLFVLFAMVLLPLRAQTTLSLDSAISIAQANSIEAQRARYNYWDACYQYRLYRKSLLPQLSLSGSLPAFNRTISKITMPDGSEAFVSQSTGNYAATLNLRQPIPFTGGSFYASTGLQRLDIYMDNTTTSYLANIVNFGISQPIITYNTYKWQKKMEPLALQKAERQYAEVLENIAFQTVIYFFELLETQETLALKVENKQNSDTLLATAREKFAIGKFTEAQVLEVEVDNLNLSLEIEQLLQELSNRTRVLCDYIGWEENVSPRLQIPETITITTIDYSKALSEYRENSQAETDHKHRLLQAQSEVARAKADNGFSFNLNASFGLSKNDELFRNVYRNPLDQEQVTLSFEIPILDWGVARCKRRKAENLLANEELAIRQETLDSEQKLSDAVGQFNIQNHRLQLAVRTAELSQKRYEITAESYALGKIGFLDFSTAQYEKDNARITYLQALATSWQCYYQIRKMTLFDFENGGEGDNGTS